MSQDLNFNEICQTLFDDVMLMACSLLEDPGEFSPVAEVLHKNDEFGYFALEMDGVQDAKEYNVQFLKYFKEYIEEHEVKAAAVALNVTSRKGFFKKEDAILVNIQTRVGEFIDLLTPYKKKDGEIELGQTIHIDDVKKRVGNLFSKV